MIKILDQRNYYHESSKAALAKLEQFSINNIKNLTDGYCDKESLGWKSKRLN